MNTVSNENVLVKKCQAGQTGYMAGNSHADIRAANLNVVLNAPTPTEVRQASGAPASTFTGTTTGGGGGGGY